MPPAREPVAAPAAPTPTPPTFESAMERLEHIVEQMENSRLPLEELIRCYEEGTQLIRVCSERLSVAEQRIETITRDASGQPKVSEYPPSTGTLPATPPPKSSKETKPLPDASDAPSPGRPIKNHHEVSLF